MCCGYKSLKESSRNNHRFDCLGQTKLMSWSSDFPTLIIQNQNFNKKKLFPTTSLKNVHVRRHALFFSLKKSPPTNLNLFCIRRLVSVCQVLLYNLLKTLDVVYNFQITEVNHLRLLHKLHFNYFPPIMKWNDKIHSSRVTPLTLICWLIEKKILPTCAFATSITLYKNICKKPDPFS